MKTNKTISIDIDVASELQDEDNQSALIERLLREHYDMEEDDG